MFKWILICCLYFALNSFDKAVCAVVTNNQDTVLVITFQDFFKNDEINLDVNDKSIFKGEVISSYQVGVTDVMLTFVKKNKHAILCTYGKNSITIKNRLKPHIRVTLNGKISNFFIDLRLGKYVGLNKKNEGQFELIQSKTPFFYD